MEARGARAAGSTAPGGVRGAARVAAALARNTFLEAVRDRVLYLLLFFAIFVFGASRLLAPLALGEGRRVTLDLGFAAISAFGCLATIFVGHQLIFREVERKTLYFLFARPVRRGEFVAGKYLGLCAILLVCVAVMGGILAGVLAGAGHALGPAFAPAIGLIFLEGAVLGAVAVLWAAATSPVLAGLLTLATWAIGHGSGDLKELLALSPSAGAQSAVEALSWVVPRLYLFADTLPVLAGTGYPADRLAWAAIYAFGYAGAALVGAALLLRRREFSL